MYNMTFMFTKWMISGAYKKYIIT